MASLEEIRKKEKEYECYGSFLSDIKKELKDGLADLIDSGIADSEKKISGTYPDLNVGGILEKMKTSYLNAISKYSLEIDKIIDEALKNPVNSSSLKIQDNILKNKMDKEKANALKMELLALNQYHSELLQIKRDIILDNVPDFFEEANKLIKIEATTIQIRNEMEVMADLFSNKKSSGDTSEIEDSVMNMSIG
uniref:Unkown protein n=1 Tax=Riptortus pedestris TaxID=329032 RepID=R4WT83_RIPPE|nr:unkown protein [Riptortus pedestris]